MGRFIGNYGVAVYISSPVWLDLFWSLDVEKDGGCENESEYPRSRHEAKCGLVDHGSTLDLVIDTSG